MVRYGGTVIPNSKEQCGKTNIDKKSLWALHKILLLTCVAIQSSQRTNKRRKMSAPPTNNAFLLWLQDDSHNDFLTKKALQEMYVCFDASAASPLAMLKDDDRKHCLLAFVKEGGCTTAALLHHTERFPARMGRSTPWDGKWFMTAGQAIAGHWLTYNMPGDFLDCTAGHSQTYVADRIQREIADAPGVRELEIWRI